MIQNIYLVFRNIFRKKPYYLPLLPAFLPQQLHSLGTRKLAMSSEGAQEATQFPLQLQRDFGKIPARHIAMDFIIQKEDVHLLNHKQSCCSPGVLHNLVRAMVGRVDCHFAAIVELAPLTHLQFTRGRRHFPSSERWFTCAGSPRGDLFS